MIQKNAYSLAKTYLLLYHFLQLIRDLIPELTLQLELLILEETVLVIEISFVFLIYMKKYSLFPRMLF